MKTVSKERLEEIAALEVKTTSSGLRHAPGMVSTVGSFDVVMMARELLALRERAEPAYYLNQIDYGDGEGFELRAYFRELDAMKSKDDFGGVVIPAYTAPPAPVVPDYMTIPMIREKLPHISFSEAAGYSAGWNACRAAMLAAEPVSIAYKLPDWWIKCSERMPNHEQQVWAHFKFDDGTTATGFAIWDDEEKDWYFELDECGDLIARGKLMKNPDICVANITHWMPLPAAPGKE